MLQGDAAKAKVSPTRYACGKAQSLLKHCRGRCLDISSQTQRYGLWYRVGQGMSIA